MSPDNAPVDTIICRDNYQLWHGDCLQEMDRIEDNSIDLMIQDPPYFRVKGDYWDRQWDNSADFIAWIGKLCEVWKRKLKPNGSLYVFASPQMSAKVEVKIGEYFNVLNNIRWIKEAGWHNKTDEEILRSYLSPWEAIIFAEHFGADNSAKGEAGYITACDDLRGFVFEPLRQYLDSEWKRAGLKREQANEACGTASMAERHFFSRSQWCLPTREHYQKLRDYANSHNGHNDYLRKDYDYLRKDYEDLRKDYDYLRKDYEDLRRPFFASEDLPYTDVWTFSTVQPYPGKHPCEKPLELLEHIINISSKPGATVLDCFFGSCNTGLACLKTGRKFIGIEADKKYFERGKQRMIRIGAELKGEWKPLASTPGELDGLPMWEVRE